MMQEVHGKLKPDCHRKSSIQEEEEEEEQQQEQDGGWGGEGGGGGGKEALHQLIGPNLRKESVKCYI